MRTPNSEQDMRKCIEDFAAMRAIVLLSFETSENLSDECTKRADRIKELEYQIKLRDTKTDELEQCRNNQRESITGFIVRTNELVDYVNELEADKTKLRGMMERGRIESRKLIDRNVMYFEESVSMKTRIEDLETELKYMVAGERATEEEIERLCKKILDIEGREDLVTTELEHRASVAEDRLRVVKEMRDELLEDWEAKRATVIRDEADLELLEDILKIVNPLIKSGAYAKPSAESRLLEIQMHGLCQTVVQYRRNHNIVGRH